MSSRVLVVGGAGYVGGALTDCLLEAGYEVRIYDLLLYEQEYRKPVDLVVGDLRDEARLLPQLSWAEVVVWLAAIVGDGACDAVPDAARAINETSVGWLASHFNGRIIFPSTSMVYGIAQGTLDETAPTAPQSLYVRTKLAAEQLLAGRNATIFRLGTLFGIPDDWTRPRFDLVVHRFCWQAATTREITIEGGQQVRPFLHVGDAAAVFAQAVAHPATGVFNLSQENTSVSDLAKRVCGAFAGAHASIVPRPGPLTADFGLSSERAARTFGFAPRLTLEDGIAEVARLLQSGRLKDPEDPRYNNMRYLQAHPIA